MRGGKREGKRGERRDERKRERDRERQMERQREALLSVQNAGEIVLVLSNTLEKLHMAREWQI